MTGAPTNPGDALAELWSGVGGASDALERVTLSGGEPTLPSIYPVGTLAVASVAAANLAAAELWRARGGPVAAVRADMREASISFRSERHLRVEGGAAADAWAPLSGDYPTGDGRWIKLHCNFAHHGEAVLRVLGVPDDRAAVAAALLERSADEVETAVLDAGGCAAAMRSPRAWAAHPQGRAVAALPLVEITGLDPGAGAGAGSAVAGSGSLVAGSGSGVPRSGSLVAGSGSGVPRSGSGVPRSGSAVAGSGSGVPGSAVVDGMGAPPARAPSRPLEGIRVLDLTRVIAGPVCGRVLAGHGADVLRVGSPHLPVIDLVVIDTGFGKRFCHLDLRLDEGRDCLRGLVRSADVFVQAYRPGALAAVGFGPDEVARLRPGIVYASLSAYGRSGPWAHRRGFDSLLQMSTGIAEEAASVAGAAAPLPLPGQALDHGTGWLAALGIMTALRRRAEGGGSWHVQVSLARTARWLDQLGRIDGLGLAEPRQRDVADLLSQTSSPFGDLTHVRPPGDVEGASPRWDTPPHARGSDEPAWADR